MPDHMLAALGYRLPAAARAHPPRPGLSLGPFAVNDRVPQWQSPSNADGRACGQRAGPNRCERVRAAGFDSRQHVVIVIGLPNEVPATRSCP